MRNKMKEHLMAEHYLDLLKQAAPHVYASAQAEHMLDGFRPRRRDIDTLVEQIKAVTDGARHAK